MKRRTITSSQGWDFGDALKLRRALKLDAAGAPRSHVRLLARRLGTTPDELLAWGAAHDDPELRALATAHRS
jgi:hypothetical protein